MSRGRFFAGTSGWSYNHWRGLFYPVDLPQREWFTHYLRHFPTVEVNYTFYRLPAPKTFVRWRDQSPPGFSYALKAPRSLTHLKKLRDCSELLEAFLERARLLEDRLGPILYQLPPNWKCDASRLGDFLGLLPEDLVQVFEFRDQSWYCDRVLGLLTENNVGFCYSSLPGLACPLLSAGRIVYARMHGVGVKYGGCYTMGQLKDLAGRLQVFVNLGYDVFVYFNNDAQAYAVENAYDLRHLVEDRRGE